MRDRVHADLVTMCRESVRFTNCLIASPGIVIAVRSINPPAAALATAQVTARISA
jgi:hypothetical protein